MIKFKYTGDCAAGEVTCFGVTFPKGKAVEVREPHAIVKLRDNPHFSEVKPRAKADAKDQS